MLDHSHECDAAHVQPLCLPESAKVLTCNTFMARFRARKRPYTGFRQVRKDLFAGADFVELQLSQEDFFIHRARSIIECIGEADSVTQLG